jgi:hypothetical protein
MIKKLLLAPFKIVYRLVTYPFRALISIVGKTIALIIRTAVAAAVAILIFIVVAAYTGVLPGIEAEGVDAISHLPSLLE